MCNDDDEGQSLAQPEDVGLPLFVYGNLKPGELAFDLISCHVSSQQPGELHGHLWVRDGVPLIQLHAGDGAVSGHILRLSPEGYDNVAKFEPLTHYQWSTAFCMNPVGVQVNVLVPAAGVVPDRSGGDVQHEPWSSARDPLFTYGLAAVATTLRSDGRRSFADTSLGDGSNWTRFYRLQAAYSLTCSILERIAFRVAPNSGPTAKLRTTGRQPEFLHAVQEVVQIGQRRAVYRSDKPHKKPARLTQPDQFASWAYQIRSNLMHRGKSAWNEADLVRTALIDLHDVLRVYLLAKVPNFRTQWTETEPQGEPYSWRIGREFEALPNG